MMSAAALQMSCVAALLALAVVAGGVALSQRGQARDAAVVADAQRLGAEALTNDRLDQALLLARAGVWLHDSTPTRSSLLSVLMRSPAALRVLTATGWSLYAAAVSPDRKLVAVGGERGYVRISDAATGRPLTPSYRLRDGLVQTLAFSPDGRTLAVAGQEPQDLPPGALLDLIDPRTGARRHRIVLPHFPDPSNYISAEPVFLPNGHDLVVEQQHNDYPGGPASVLWRVDGRTGTVRRPSLRVGTRAASMPTLTADGRRLFVTSVNDHATFEIDPRRLRVLHRYPIGDVAGAVSPDGTAFALGSQVGGMRLLDLRSGAVRRFAGRHQGPVERVRFTPDGRTIVTSAADGDVIAWDVGRGEIRETFSGHNAGDMYGLAVSTDGRTAYSAASDGRAIVWDLAGDRRLDRPFAAGRPFVADSNDQYPIELAITPDGRTLALTQDDGTVVLVDTRTLRRRGRLRAMRGFTAAVDYSPDGRLLAVTGKGGTITLWDAHTLRPAGTLLGLRTTSQALAFSPDHRLFAAAALGTNVRASSYVGSTVRIWDVHRRALTPVAFRPRHEMFISSLAFSPDGRRVAATMAGDGTEVRDAHTGRLVARLPTDDVARSVAFSPDGRLVAVGQIDGRVLLWSARDWRAVGRPVEAHEGRVITVGFSGDSRTLATASEDGTARLWDVAGLRPVGSALVVDHGRWTSAALTPDGTHLLAVSDRGHGVRWDISPASWLRHACGVAGRELTAREWQDALPGRPYASICGG